MNRRLHRFLVVFDAMLVLADWLCMLKRYDWLFRNMLTCIRSTGCCASHSLLDTTSQSARTAVKLLT